MRTSRSLAAALALVIVVTLTACGNRDGRTGPPESPAGSEERTIEVDGVTREYRVHVPTELADDPALVLMLHGGFGSAAQAERVYGWNEQADGAGFVVAYPEGANRAWNAGDCCGRAAAQDVDDVAFLAALTAELQQEFGICPERTFGTGMSNGAMMAYRMACDTDVFAAIAPVAGTIVTDCVDPAPTSVLHIHGAADEMVRMDGERGAGAAHVDGMPIADVAALWRDADDCPDPSAAVAGGVTTIAAVCPDGRRVTLITVAGAGHQWPGSDSREGAADQPSTAFNATGMIWRFFDET